MAALTVQNIAPAGLEATYSAANSSETMAIDGNERHFLHVKNGGGGSINVTVTAVQTSTKKQGVGTLTISNQVVAVGAAAEKFIGPFSNAYRNTSSNVAIAYSGTSSVTAAALKLPAQS